MFPGPRWQLSRGNPLDGWWVVGGGRAQSLRRGGRDFENKSDCPGAHPHPVCLSPELLGAETELREAGAAGEPGSRAAAPPGPAAEPAAPAGGLPGGGGRAELLPHRLRALEGPRAGPHTLCEPGMQSCIIAPARVPGPSN